MKKVIIFVSQEDRNFATTVMAINKQLADIERSHPQFRLDVWNMAYGQWEVNVSERALPLFLIHFKPPRNLAKVQFWVHNEDTQVELAQATR